VHTRRWATQRLTRGRGWCACDRRTRPTRETGVSALLYPRRWAGRPRTPAARRARGYACTGGAAARPCPPTPHHPARGSPHARVLPRGRAPPRPSRPHASPAGTARRGTGWREGHLDPLTAAGTVPILVIRAPAAWDKRPATRPTRRVAGRVRAAAARRRAAVSRLPPAGAAVVGPAWRHHARMHRERGCRRQHLQRRAGRHLDHTAQIVMWVLDPVDQECT